MKGIGETTPQNTEIQLSQNIHSARKLRSYEGWGVGGGEKGGWDGNE